jgi:hypothetical protein
MKTNTVDLLICSLPALTVDRVPGAPAMLKSAAMSAGYTSRSVDLSINFFKSQCNSDVDLYIKNTQGFRPNLDSTPEISLLINEWITDSINIIREINPTIIGLSVFSTHQHRACFKLAQALREQLPNIKIIIGGYGLSENCQSLTRDSGIKKIDLIKPFYQFLTDEKLCDYVVKTDPLNQLINILEEVIGNKIGDYKKEYTEQKVLFEAPIPDYSDYSLTEYVWNEGIALPVTGSKGCVRSCTFCDVPSQFGRFKYRTGKDIANEIMYLHKTHNVRIFEFTDSLVNGSLLAFTEWLEIIAEYNDAQTEENKIHWYGQYICRPQSIAVSKTYPLMMRSGVINLVIGVESGSNDVLAAMKKGMKVEDALAELEIFGQYGIKTHLLMLGGFYNETWERYLESLDFIVKCQPHAARGTITKLSVGLPLFINERTQLYHDAEQLGIILDPLNGLNWRMADDESTDFIERCQRRVITQLVLDKLGLPMSDVSITNIHHIHSALLTYRDELIEKLNVLR